MALLKSTFPTIPTPSLLRGEPFVVTARPLTLSTPESLSTPMTPKWGQKIKNIFIRSPAKLLTPKKRVSLRQKHVQNNANKNTSNCPVISKKTDPIPITETGYESSENGGCIQKPLENKLIAIVECERCERTRIYTDILAAVDL